MTRPSFDSVISDERKFFTGAITTATLSLAAALMPSSVSIVMVSTITCACKAPGCMAVPGPARKDNGRKPRGGGGQEGCQEDGCMWARAFAGTDPKKTNTIHRHE